MQNYIHTRCCSQSAESCSELVCARCNTTRSGHVCKCLTNTLGANCQDRGELHDDSCWSHHTLLAVPESAEVGQDSDPQHHIGMLGAAQRTAADLPIHLSCREQHLAHSAHSTPFERAAAGKACCAVPTAELKHRSSSC